MVVFTNLKLLNRVNFLGVLAKISHLYFVHNEVEFNYYMTDIQAAFGTDQIDRLESFIEIELINYKLYKKFIADIDLLELLGCRMYTRSSHWSYSVIVDKEKYSMHRDELLQKLNNNNIHTKPLLGLIHKHNPIGIEELMELKDLYFMRRI